MDDSTPVRTAVREEGAAGEEAFPAEIPLEFRSQRTRHRDFKRRGPPSGSRFDEEDIGETRATLSSRFFDADDETTPTPPPPPPPPPPAALTRANLPKHQKVKEGIQSKAAAAALARQDRAPASGPQSATPETAAAGGTADAARAAQAEESSEPDTGTADTSDPAAVGDGDSVKGGAPARAGKRKVGTERRDEGITNESPHKAPVGSGAFSGGGKSIGEGSSGLEAETAGTAEALEPLPLVNKKDKGKRGGKQGDQGHEGGADNDGHRQESPLS